MRSSPSRSAVPGAMRPRRSRNAASGSTAGGTSAPDGRKAAGGVYVPIVASLGLGISQRETGSGAEEPVERRAEVGDLDQPHARRRRSGVLGDQPAPVALPRGLGQPPAEPADPADLAGQAHLAERDQAVGQ